MRWLAGAAILTCLVLLGPSAPSSTPSAKPLPAEAVRDIASNRVMTWNICNPCGTEHNAGRAAEIASYAPQVIGLQEACQRDVERIRDFLRSRYGLKYHVEYGMVLRNMGRCGGFPWNAGAYGQAILSAAPMTDRENVEYPEGGSEDRGYMAVTTKVGGQSVRVFNTHLAEREQADIRAKQVPVFAAAFARHQRAIAIGDFNATPESPELGRMWPLARDTDPQCRPRSTGDCRVTTDWYSKFDYIFPRGFEPLGHQVRQSEHSDHHLVRADLKPT
ncbi:endonuclease/exonuclease/phosphatase family protein [Streptomyces boninensis]|uniref:endonuclease/exonuclease/phosphatase family protein n=1 Tax=Streptomyces boninensis TaxID=2039455 RepID=UPI003B219B2D